MKVVILAGGLGTRLGEETTMLRDKIALTQLWESGKAPWAKWKKKGE